MFHDQEFVYFIHNGRIGDDSEIKIGWSHSPDKRIQDLQTASGRILTVEGVIPFPQGSGMAYAEEQLLHNLFHQHIAPAGNEWFKDVKQIRHKIATSLTDNHLLENFKTYLSSLRKLDDPKSIDNYIFRWVKNNLVPALRSSQRIVVFAPPKSGKRKMIQSCVLLYPFAKHILITGQNKNDMQSQQQEYDGICDYIVATSASKNYDAREGLLSKIKKQISNYSGEVVFHFDECDFASGVSKNDQTRSVHNRIKKLIDGTTSHVKFVSYSATPEEAVFTDPFPELTLIFRPLSSYIGADYYCDHSYEVKKFFVADSDDFQLSDQGIECLQTLIRGSKQFGVVRVSYNENKRQLFATLRDNKKELERKIKQSTGVDINVITIDESNSKEYKWLYKNRDDGGNVIETGFWMGKNGKYLVLINKVAERGTEIGFHPDIAFWHEYVGDKTSYATAAQRIGRVFCYSSYYDNKVNVNFDNDFRSEEINIKLYCNKGVLETMKEICTAKDGREFREIWEKSKIERPIGSSKRIKFGSNNTTEAVVCICDTEQQVTDTLNELYASGHLIVKEPKYPDRRTQGIARSSTNKMAKGSFNYYNGITSKKMPSRKTTIMLFDAPRSEHQKLWDEHPEIHGRYVLWYEKNGLSQSGKTIKSLTTMPSSIHPKLIQNGASL